MTKKHNIKILALLFYLSISALRAQNIQVLMSPKPSPYISDWQDRTETVKLVITNSKSSDITVKIKTELSDGKGFLIANTDAAKMPVLTVPPGTTVYNPEDVFPTSAIQYHGTLDKVILQTGRIPDDNYKICIALTDPQTGLSIGTSGTVCKSFTITAYQAPVLISPSNKEIIKAQNIKGMMFRWTPIIPIPPMIVTYKLQVWEVLDGQTPMIALRSNQPIVEKDLKGVMQTQWPVDFALPDTGNFVWTITPFDEQDRKLVDGNGFAEPFEFKVCCTGAIPFPIPPTITLQLPSNNQEVKGDINFSWGDPHETSGDGYTLRIVELKSDQSPEDAIVKNTPVFEQKVIKTKSFKLGDSVGKLKKGKKYAWAVNGGTGFSESYVFQILEVLDGQTDYIKLISPLNNENVTEKSEFNWTGITDRNAGYTLRIVELKRDESPEETFRRKPMIEKDYPGKITSFQFSEISSKLAKGNTYLWQISSGNVKSEVWSFCYCEKQSGNEKRMPDPKGRPSPDYRIIEMSMQIEAQSTKDPKTNCILDGDGCAGPPVITKGPSPPANVYYGWIKRIDYDHVQLQVIKKDSNISEFSYQKVFASGYYSFSHPIYLFNIPRFSEVLNVDPIFEVPAGKYKVTQIGNLITVDFPNSRGVNHENEWPHLTKMSISSVEQIDLDNQEPCMPSDECTCPKQPSIISDTFSFLRENFLARYEKITNDSILFTVINDSKNISEVNFTRFFGKNEFKLPKDKRLASWITQGLGVSDKFTAVAGYYKIFSKGNQVGIIFTNKNKVSKKTENNLSYISPTPKTPSESLRPLFNWSMASSNEGLLYHFKLIKLEPSQFQNPIVAIRSTKPILEISGIQKNRYEYPLNSPELEKGQIYAWVVWAYVNGSNADTTEFPSKIGIFEAGYANQAGEIDCKGCYIGGCSGRCVTDGLPPGNTCYCFELLPSDQNHLGGLIVSLGIGFQDCQEGNSDCIRAIGSNDYETNFFDKHCKATLEKVSFDTIKITIFKNNSNISEKMYLKNFASGFHTLGSDFILDSELIKALGVNNNFKIAGGTYKVFEKDNIITIYFYNINANKVNSANYSLGPVFIDDTLPGLTITWNGTNPPPKNGYTITFIDKSNNGLIHTSLLSAKDVITNERNMVKYTYPSSAPKCTPGMVYTCQVKTNDLYSDVIIFTKDSFGFYYEIPTPKLNRSVTASSCDILFDAPIVAPNLFPVYTTCPGKSAQISGVKGDYTSIAWLKQSSTVVSTSDYTITFAGNTFVLRIKGSSTYLTAPGLKTFYLRFNAITGCPAKTVTLKIQVGPPNPTFNIPNYLCLGNPLVLNATNNLWQCGAPNQILNYNTCSSSGVFSCSPSPGFISISGGINTFTPTSTGTYSITYTSTMEVQVPPTSPIDASGCSPTNVCLCSKSVTRVIHVNLPTIFNAAVCSPQGNIVKGCPKKFYLVAPGSATCPNNASLSFPTCNSGSNPTIYFMIKRSASGIGSTPDPATLSGLSPLPLTPVCSPLMTNDVWYRLQNIGSISSRSTILPDVEVTNSGELYYVVAYIQFPINCCTASGYAAACPAFSVSSVPALPPGINSTVCTASGFPIGDYNQCCEKKFVLKQNCSATALISGSGYIYHWILMLKSSSGSGQLPSCLTEVSHLSTYHASGTCPDNLLISDRWFKFGSNSNNALAPHLPATAFGFSYIVTCYIEIPCGNPSVSSNFATPQSFQVLLPSAPLMTITPLSTPLTSPLYVCQPITLNVSGAPVGSTYTWSPGGTTGTSFNVSTLGTNHISVSYTSSIGSTPNCKVIATKSVVIANTVCDTNAYIRFNDSFTFKNALITSDGINFSTNDDETPITDPINDVGLVNWVRNDFTFDNCRSYWNASIYAGANSNISIVFPEGAYKKAGFSIFPFYNVSGSYAIKVYSGCCVYTFHQTAALIPWVADYFGVSIATPIDKIEVTYNNGTFVVDNFRYGN